VRLISYHAEGCVRPGVERDGQVLDARRLLGGRGPGSMLELLRGGPDAMSRLAEAAASAAAAGAVVGALEHVRLAPPVPGPEKVVCVGLNYRDHAEETGLALPARPVWFAKFANAVSGPRDAIVRPAETESLDYEAELAVVVGRRARDVAPADALGHVAGAMCLNDVSARELQFESGQFSMGKTFDTFAPCGPALVTLDEVGDLQQLGVRTRVNGVVVQDGSTADMVFSVAELVSFVSKRLTLVPGDIISTGTPAGVGMAADPPRYLRAGSVVEVEIDGLGRLINPVVDDDICLADGRAERNRCS
jgi:2-keto-4-pentenoate hydratase/2-oxohepta-3-ene-1,7-dioic acid hydratase in catechol pathway